MKRIIIICLYLFVAIGIAYGQNYKEKATALFYEGNYSSAQKNFKAALTAGGVENEKEKAVLEKNIRICEQCDVMVAEAKVFFDKGYYTSALTKYNEVLQLNGKDKNAGKMVGLCRSKIKLAEERKKEQVLWDSITRENRLEAYTGYLEKYPNGAFVELAKEKRESIIWGMAKTVGNLSSVESYLGEFPRGQYRMQGLALKDDLLWAQACKVNTVEGYKDFKSKYPGSSHVSEIANAVNKIDDEKLWKKAVSVNTVEGYQNYQTVSVFKFFKAQAIRAINILQDSDSWNRIKDSRNVADFEIYLNGVNPDKQFVSDAQDKLNVLYQAEDEKIWADAISKNTEEAYSQYQKSSIPVKKYQAEAKDRSEGLKVNSLGAKGFASLRAGNFNEALFFANSALDIQPENPQMLKLKKNANEGILYLSLGESDNITDLEKFMQLYPSGTYAGDVSSRLAGKRKALKRQMWWDDRVQLGLGVDYMLMDYMQGFSVPKIRLKIGESTDLINFSVGVQYRRYMGGKVFKSSKEEMPSESMREGRVNLNQVAFPVTLKMTLGGHFFLCLSAIAPPIYLMLKVRFIRHCRNH